MISIHASREGSDIFTMYGDDGDVVFQSTLPAREATPDPNDASKGTTISIHASREGSDAGRWEGLAHFDISIHASREGSDIVSTS